MEGVVPTTPVAKVFRKLEEEAEHLDKKAEKEDLVLADLNGDDRWEAMKKVIDSLIESLSDTDINDTDTVEMFGFRTLARKVAVAHLRAVRNLPETIKDTKVLDEK